MAEKRVVSLIDTETHEITRYEVALLDDETSEAAAMRVLEYEENTQDRYFLVSGIERA